MNERPVTVGGAGKFNSIFQMGISSENIRKSKNVVIKQNKDTAYRVLDGEAVIVDLESSELYSLNPTATVIWETCEEEVTLEEVVDRVVEEFEVEREVAEEDCIEFVEEFSENGLLLVTANGGV